ncbi:MAG: hypothetical protein P8M03_05870 [Flavobacteriaceae bacterium]|nr:hypothetical protein [Flavobacteriaceae bacterium]
MFFNQVIGQKKLLEQLKLSQSSGTFSHSSIFIDSNCYGGLPIALGAAMCLLYEKDFLSNELKKGKEIFQFYENPDLLYLFPLPDSKAQPSDYYKDWLSFIKRTPYGNVSDWLNLISSGNKQGNISVENVESIIYSLNLKSYGNRNKICLIWGLEKIKPQAGNKLLKLIEEPPPNTYFLFITNNPDSILSTIKSRCQLFHLPLINKKDLSAYFKSLNWDKETIISAVRSSNGSLRSALQLKDNIQHSILLETKAVALFRLAVKAKRNKAVIVNLMNWSNEIGSWGKLNQKELLNYMSNLIRNALLISYNAKKIVNYQSNIDFKIDFFSPYVHSKNIENLTALISKTQYAIERNANGKILFADFSLKITRLLNIQENS